jgi:hypothetical protein
LDAAVVAGDLLGVCKHEVYTSLWLASIPLIRRGITPSSTRSLIQLEDVLPEWKWRICEWEGSASLAAADVIALLPAVAEGLSLRRALPTSQWGDLHAYMAGKAEWLARKGQHRDAYHVMWFIVGGLYEGVRTTEDPAVVSKANTFVRTWLRSVGWEGQEVLEEKVRVAEEMVAEVEAMAADLPSAES